jgi:hypothetical protein
VTTLEEPSLSEIARTLADFRNEMRGQLAAFQRADVYAADRREVDLRIKNVEDRAARVEADREKDQAEKTSRSRQITLAILAAALSLVVQIVVLVVR